MKQINIFIILILTLIPRNIYGRVLGSANTPSRQLTAFLPSSDNDNELNGFAVFEQGITLESPGTSCTYDAFFPIFGSIVLNGGTLVLGRDLTFKSPFGIGAGTISGEHFSIEFPSNISHLDVPRKGHSKRLLQLVSKFDIQDDVYTADWAYNDTYIAIGADSTGGISELQIYYLNDDVLTLTKSYDPGSYDVYSVRWHPSAYYLAMGQERGIELNIFEWNPALGTLTQTDSDNIGKTRAVSWAPNGNFLAVGNYDFNVYEFASGNLGTKYSFNSLGGFIQNNALSWHYTNSFIAVGTRRAKGSNGAELVVLEFDGVSLSKNAELEVNSHVYAVDWRPNTNILAVSYSKYDERLRLYQHNSQSGTLTEITTARTAENSDVLSINWSSDGEFLAIGTKRDSNDLELKIYYYHEIEQTLSLVSGQSFGDSVLGVRWAHNNTYIATGDAENNFSLFKFIEEPLIFENSMLFFNSDVAFQGTIEFSGDCIINSAWNTLDFANTTLVVDEGSSLRIEQAQLKNISGNKLCCRDAQGVITLRDIIWIQDGDFTFTLGAMQFNNDVFMKGDDTKFIYQSAQTSTLLSKSSIILDAGFTFSYDPILVAQKELLEFEDATSVLNLNGATVHATATGICLCKGKLLVQRDSFMSSEREIQPGEFFDTVIDEGIMFGKSQSEYDFMCEILSGSTLRMKSGALHYRNVLPSSWQMQTVSSVLEINSNTRLNLYENLNLGVGRLTLLNNSIIGRVPTKNITGSLQPFGTVLRDFLVG